MIARLAINPDQVRWYAQSALSGFDTLSPENAVENAKADLRSLLVYLDAANDAVLVLGIEPVEPRVWRKAVIGDPKVTNFV